MGVFFYNHGSAIHSWANHPVKLNGFIFAGNTKISLILHSINPVFTAKTQYRSGFY
jgi:hypothetical protein